MILVGAFVFALGLSISLTAWMRRYALSRELLDQPNARSSHTTATPRGGGVAVVAACCAVASGLTVFGSLPVRFAAALLGSGLLVALVGFVDNHIRLAARWRFLAHAVAAAWAIWMMGGIPPVPIFGHSIDLAWFGIALAAIYIVWSTNFYNFMDGIDGIASIEAITVSLGGAFVWWLAGSGDEWIAAVLLAACTAGFLVWNYPPARIFMGDSGSGFLGFTIAVMSLWCGHTTPHLFWSWFILGGTFMVDATTTLVRRVRRGERPHEAHRSHAYQYAARKYGSHKKVALAYGCINIVWLFPIALLVALGMLDGAAGTVIAYAPLVWLAFKYKAGDRAAQEL